MRQVQILEYAGRNAGARECLEKALGAQRRLVRMLEHHRIAGDQRGQHGIDRRQVGIIPGRDDGDDAERYALDLPLKAGLVAGLNGGERLRRDARACSARVPRSRGSRRASGEWDVPSAR